jgi:acetyl esterase/lipase
MLFRFARFTALLAASAVLPSCTPVDALNASIDTSGLRIDRAIAYAPGRMGRMDVYRPARPQATALPLVVFIHGGAWKSGERGEYRFVGAPLAKSGVVVAIPDYRKTPEVGFPTFLEDNASAVAFARAHAAEWGADPHRIFLAGHSAGGYNALMLALDPRYLAAAGVPPADIAGVMALAAPADFLPSTDPDAIAAFGEHPDPAQMEPIAFAHADEPPVLLLHGDLDDVVTPQNTVSMASRIAAAGGRVTVKRFPNLGHIGLVVAIAPISAWRAPVLKTLVNFIRHPG